MGSDKFPEAFNRFVEKVDIKNIKSWKQLLAAFASWAGRNWIPTQRQIDALHDEAERLGIPTNEYRTREQEVQRIFGQSATFAQQREMRFSSSYVSHHEWLNKNARSTPYQRRVIAYIRNHPNATLREARGHRRR